MLGRTETWNVDPALWRLSALAETHSHQRVGPIGVRQFTRRSLATQLRQRDKRRDIGGSEQVSGVGPSGAAIVLTAGELSRLDVTATDIDGGPPAGTRNG